MENDNAPANASGREYRKKRVEELGSALAQIRARVKASRGSGPKKDDEPELSGGSKPQEDPTHRTAITKKILEEDRARFSTLQKKRERMKEEFNQILIEREEQKKVEKQLHETIAKVTAPMPELPPLIKQRIIDLETNVETLKEQLSEKDKVLSTKTQSLTVLYNQLMQRSQEQVEKAVAFTQEISNIKEDFAKREEHLKREIAALREREEELELKLSEKERSRGEVEALETELCEVRRELDEAQIKIEEVTNALESTKKINMKLKAQLKAMKIERDKLKEVQENSEDVELLKNRIALLEEEKESQVKFERHASHLENEYSNLKEHFKALEEEKSSLQTSLESADIKIKEQDDAIASLRTSFKEIEEQKISAEMRAIEIEERMENFLNKFTSEIEQQKLEIHRLECQIEEKNSIIDSLSNQLSLKEQEIFDIKGNNFSAEVESDSRLREIESYNSELVEKVRELQLKSDGHERAVIQLNESLTEKNETINVLKNKCDDLSTTVVDLNNNKALLENEILSLRESVNKNDKQTKDNADNKDDSNLKFKKLAANYKMKVKLCQELEDKLKQSQISLEERTSEIVGLNSQVNDLQSELEEIRFREREQSVELNDIKEKNEQLLKVVEDLVPKLQALEAEKSDAFLRAEQMSKALDDLKEWKDGDSKILKDHVNSVNAMASNVSLLEQELASLQTILNEKNGVIGELEAERKTLLEDMKSSEEELERLRNLYQSESTRNQNVLTNLQGLESEMLGSREEMNQIAEQLESVTKSYNTCLGNLQERENYIEALEQDIVGMKTKMYNLEAGISDRHRLLEERGNQLSARLEEAEILSHNFDKYQSESEKKIRMLEENEMFMKDNLMRFENENEVLKKCNAELYAQKDFYEKRISEMSIEIDTIQIKKNTYNAALERVEELTEELKKVMSEFEVKDVKMDQLAQERADIFNKLTDLESDYSDLKVQLEESEKTVVKLQTELVEKSNILDEALSKVKSLEEKIDSLTSEKPVAMLPPAVINPSEVQVFSWDQHSQPGGDLGLYFGNSSVEKTSGESEPNVQPNQEDIEFLRSQMNTILTEKDSEISVLKDNISKLLTECNDMRVQLTSFSQPESISTFSWDQHENDTLLPASLQKELEDSNNKLKLAEEEITQLKSSLDSLVSSYQTENTSLKEGLQIIVSEKQKLEESLSSSINNEAKNDVQLFSWGDNGTSVQNAGSEKYIQTLKEELQDKTRSLEIALLDLKNLQIKFDQMLNDKDSHINLLREEINTVLSEKENLSKSAPEVPSESLPEAKEGPWGHGDARDDKDEGEGWGWGAEAHLEQKHLEGLQINQLSQKIQELEMERNSLTEKLNASKIKCMKLIKKLKETEAIKEQTKNEKSVGFSDLDFALQEEMRSQLDQLETKNKELTLELNSLKLERDNLLKRVDVLVSAQDQMIEMKERQDIEVQMWQKRSVELKNEVQALQWSLEELRSEKAPFSSEDGELLEKCNALAAENEKLQGIICNLRDGRPVGSPDLVVELAALKDEVAKLSGLRVKDKQIFDTQLKKANEELDAMEQHLEELTTENNFLKTQHQEAAKTESNELVETLKESNTKIQSELSAQRIHSSGLEDQVQVLLNEKKCSENKICELNGALSQLRNQVDSFSSEKEELQKENDDNNSQSTNNQFKLLKENYEKVLSDLNTLHEDIRKIKAHNVLLEEELAVSKGENNLEIQNLMKNVELAESNYKNVEDNLKSITQELLEFDPLINDLAVKCQISSLPSNNIDKLKEILVSINKIIEENQRLSNEITILRVEKPTTSSEPSLFTSPPVFKGFSSSTDDPFEDIQSSQNEVIDKLQNEIVQMKSIINSYELELSQVKSENLNLEKMNSDLKAEIMAMNEHVGKLNLQRSNLMDDVARKLEAADSEIARWREEASNLRREINNLVEKHALEIEEIRRTDVGSKEKLSEIEENYQNTMLNKDQESGYLKQILSEKEQLLANAINERNALQVQYEAVSQQLFVLESRVRDLNHKNQEAQSSLDQSRRDGSIIEKQKKEIQELTAKLEYLTQSQNLRPSENSNDEQLKSQIKELSEKSSFFQQSNVELQSKLSAQSEEISQMHFTITDLENKRIYLEALINDKQKEIDTRSESSGPDSIPSPNGNETEKLAALIKEKDLEIARVSKVLLDTQERLVQVQEFKSTDKLISLQNKLDNALYMVHVRDVRVDELTQEIMQLLEERDSLQFRLSESLRENEILRQGTADSSATSSPEIKEKLGELRKGYKKDPVVQLDMESRHNQQMGLYSEKEDKEDELNATVNYGIFNWFFSSPTSQQSS